MTPTHEHSVALAACMRNEGLFILEWLAHHHVMGFKEIIVVTNDCLDHSDKLLDRLQELGLVKHISQNVPPDEEPQTAGMDHVIKHCRQRNISHVLHIDSDEFLDIRKPNMLIGDIVTQNPKADVIPIPWRFFGDNHKLLWEPGDLVLVENRLAERKPNPKHTKFKSLFRVNSFERARDHNPINPLVDNPIVKTPDGEKLKNNSLFHNVSSRFHPIHKATKVKTAWIAHYATRSVDIFTMKTERGKGTASPVFKKYEVGGYWHEICNQNGKLDISMQRYVPSITKHIEKWRQDPEVRRLEQDCFDWFEQVRVAYYDKIGFGSK